MPLYIQRLTKTAKLPTRATDGSAGLDLYADVSLMIYPGDWGLVSTGIAVAIDTGQVGLIWPRSGLAVRAGLDTGAGVVDEDYRGEVKVVLFNHGADPYQVSSGDRIAQLLIQSVAKPTITEMDTLPGTKRGESGFGSTGG